LMDSIEVTILRTGAATAVAARHLARQDSRIMTVIGCGNQGRVSIGAIAMVRPIESVFVWDLDSGRAANLASVPVADGRIRVQVATDWRDASRQSDIVVTCTPSRRAFLGSADVCPGAFVAAVGADNPEKQEIEPALMASAAVIPDIVAQAASIGDLRHAIEAGVMTLGDVRADLGSVVAGRTKGRANNNEIVVFDSTGTALQDVAVAAIVYERAVAAGAGMVIALA